LLLIHQIFDKLDVNSQNKILPETLLNNFHSSRHPEVMCGNKTEDDISQEFLDTFDVGSVQAGMITRDEFVKYYHNMNMIINDDDYLELILRRTWNFNDGDDIDFLEMTNQKGKSMTNMGNSGMNNSVKDRLQNAKSFGTNTYGRPVVTDSTVRGNFTPQRPSTGSGIRYSNSANNTPRQQMSTMNGNNTMNDFTLQGNTYLMEGTGDQSLPPQFSNRSVAGMMRPKSASQLRGASRNGTSTYQLMSGNNMSSTGNGYASGKLFSLLIDFHISFSSFVF
jgi:hypothetical protein